jgi:hypothetical protein
MLLFLPRLGILCRDKLGSEAVQLAVRLFDLPVQQADARDERLDVSAGGCHRSGSHLHRRLAQYRQNMRCVETPDTMAFQYLSNSSFANARSLTGRWRDLPQIEQPLGAKITFKLQHGGKFFCCAIALRAT